MMFSLREMRQRMLDFVTTTVVVLELVVSVKVRISPSNS
jgi:hypothetical protein